MKIIENLNLDEERALYGCKDTRVVNCRFDGPADGESAFKECRNISVERCYFNLRYPLWHDIGAEILSSDMTPLCRAALWYSEDVKIRNSKLHGIKALRECSRVDIESSDIISAEFGWMCRDVKMRKCSAEGEYFMFRSRELALFDLRFKGKYSFQYIENAVFENCDLDTKDAFWHAKNVTVRNCRIKGEYLAWYCENVTFERCVIIGTQPLCYCKGLRLIDCEVLEGDLAFEKSEVEATLTAPVVSIKNPASGYIYVPSAGEIILDDADSRCDIRIGEKGLSDL